MLTSNFVSAQWQLQVVGGLLIAAAAYAVYVLKRSKAFKSLPLPPGPDVAWYTPGERYV